MTTIEKQSRGIKGGARPGAGRKKGVPNKHTTELKTMILEALDQAGGVDYLVAQAQKDNAGAFMALVGKVLPMTVTGPNPDGSHSLNVSVNFVRANRTP